MAESGEQALRTLEVLDGAYVTPLVAGLSLVPVEILPGLDADPAVRLLAAARDLRLDFAFVPAAEPWAADAALSLTAEGLAVFWVVEGPLWPSLRAVGVSRALAATVRDPASLREELDGQTARMLDEVSEAPDDRVTAVVVADDIAGMTGPIASPDFILAEVVPRMARAVDVAVTAGMPVVLHSDGDVRFMLSALARAGFRGLHGGGTLDDRVFESLVRDAHAKGLSFLGGIDTAHLEAGVPAALNAGTRAAFLAQTGGMLLADDGGLTTEAQYHALVSALASARDIGAPAEQ